MSKSQQSSNRDEDKAQLLALHQRVIQAHLQKDVDGWLDIESEAYISANRGEISYPTKEERADGRRPYLAHTTFTEYRDLVSPVVQVADDGSLGWVIAQVRVTGVQQMPGQEERTLAFVSAWIELYQKIDGRWLCVGNVSNIKYDLD